MARRLAARPDRGQVPAVARAAEEDVADQEDDDQRRGVERHAENGAFAEKVPGVAVDRVGGKDGGEALVQEVDAGAQDDQRHQRGEERPRLEVADQDAVAGADHGAGEERRDDHQPDGKAEHEQAEQGGEIADGEDRADAEIDAAGDEGEGHAERDEAELGEQPHQRQHVPDRAVVLDGQREIGRKRDHHRERDDRLEPLLEQELGEEKPWRPGIGQTSRPRPRRLQGSCRHRCHSTATIRSRRCGGSGDFSRRWLYFFGCSAAAVEVGGLGTG